MKPNFEKQSDGLLPVIIQDKNTSKILMLGYMNEEAYQETLRDGKLTFFSRSKKRLWMKGETSGNYLYVKDILLDCDNDTLLIKAEPAGPVCHTGADTCFNEKNVADNFIQTLEDIIKQRKNNPIEGSYTSNLFRKGLNKIAQKVGEEAVELIIESMGNKNDLFLNEAADLLFHYLVLLRAKGHEFKEVGEILKSRNKGK